MIVLNRKNQPDYAENNDKLHMISSPNGKSLAGVRKCIKFRREEKIIRF